MGKAGHRAGRRAGRYGQGAPGAGYSGPRAPRAGRAPVKQGRVMGDGRRTERGAPGNSQLRGWVSPPDSLGGSGRAPGQKSAVPVHGRVLPALRCCRKGARQGGGRSSAGFRGHLSVAHGHYDQSGWVEGSRRWYATTAPPLPSATTGGSRKRRCGGGCFAFPDVLIPISSSGNGGIGQHAAGQGAPQHRERRRSGSRL